MAKHSASILELAKKGAAHRYQELKAELAELVKVFPHLRYGSAVSLAMPDAAVGGTEGPAPTQDVQGSLQEDQRRSDGSVGEAEGEEVGNGMIG